MCRADAEVRIAIGRGRRAISVDRAVFAEAFRATAAAVSASFVAVLAPVAAAIGSTNERAADVARAVYVAAAHLAVRAANTCTTAVDVRFGAIFEAIRAALRPCRTLSTRAAGARAIRVREARLADVARWAIAAAAVSRSFDTVAHEIIAARERAHAAGANAVFAVRCQETHVAVSAIHATATAVEVRLGAVDHLVRARGGRIDAATAGALARGAVHVLTTPIARSTEVRTATTAIEI